MDPRTALAPGAASGLKTSTEDLRALAEFFLLLATDSVAIVSRALSYDPRSSGYLKNILKAAFSSPYGLDVATSMRDAQFGVRRYEGAVLQLFDGDDSRAAWEAIGARIEARLASGKFGGAIVRKQVAKRLVVSGGKVTAVGDGKFGKDGKRIALDVKKGDVVLFGKYAGSDVKVGGEDFKILRESEILAKVEG